MNGLIKITTDGQGSSVVSAKELYEYLEVKSEFAKWCSRMFEYGFEKEKDFSPILTESTGGRPGIDYALTLDTAKEIAMLQRTEKGKRARQYFIECEKQLRGQTATPAALPSAKELALMVIRAEEEKERLLAENAKLSSKAEFTDKVLQSVDAYPITLIAKELGMSAQTLNKKLCEKCIQYKSKGGAYLLYAKYQDKGFSKLRTYAYVDNEGQPRTNTQTVWTEYGRAFIHSLFNSELSFSKVSLQLNQ